MGSSSLIANHMKNYDAVRNGIFKQLEETVQSNLRLVDGELSPGSQKTQKIVEDMMDFLFMAQRLVPVEPSSVNTTADIARIQRDAITLKAHAASDPSNDKVSPDEKNNDINSVNSIPSPEGSTSAIAIYDVKKDPTSQPDALTRLRDQLNSAQTVMTALDKIRRVDDILASCAEFWDNLDVTLETFAKLKPTDALVKMAATSPAFFRRFEIRMAEYEEFWKSLYLLCREYVRESAVQFTACQNYVKDIARIADSADSAHALKMGILTSCAASVRGG